MKTKRKWIKPLGIVGIVIVLGVWMYSSFNKETVPDLSYNELISLVMEQEVQSIELTGSTALIEKKDTEKFKAKIPDISIFTEFLQKELQDGNQIRYVKKEVANYSAFSLLLAPVMLLGLLYAANKTINKSAKTMMSQLEEVTKQGKMEIDPCEDPKKVTFKDIGGIPNQKKEFQMIVDFLKDSSKYNELGAKIPKGILMYGEPGTGKTLIAKAIAGEADVPFYQTSGSEFDDTFVGVGASRVRDLFKTARENSPCIVFIDEIDSLGTSRDSYSASNQTINQFLKEVDGFSSLDNVVIIAATNRKDDLDPAFVRSGRFDKHIYIPLPDLEERKEIIKIHLVGKVYDPKINTEGLAKKTAMFSGADIENLLNESALIAVVRSSNQIEQQDVDMAFRKIIVGIENNNAFISEGTKMRLAYHEAGHAVLGYHFKQVVTEISIIPRGTAGGYTMYEEEDKIVITKEELEKEVMSLLGGRLSEEIQFEDVSTGAQNDLERSSQIIYKMITKYGMGEYSPISTIGDAKHPFNKVIYDNAYEEAAAKIADLQEKAKEILFSKRKVLGIVAKALYDNETLSQEAFLKIMECA